MNNDIRELEKEKIANKLLEFLSRRSLSQNAGSTKLGVSVATVNKICNGLPGEGRDKWDTISPTMWRKVEGQIRNMTVSRDNADKESWHVVEDIEPFEDLKKILMGAKIYSESLGLIAPPGTGKSLIGKWLSEQENFYHIRCSVIQNVPSFMRLILKEMGLDGQGMTQGEMMELIEETLIGQHRPMLFLDEFDKVPDTVLKFYIDLYNRVEGHCGLAIGATDNLSRRVRNGVIKSKQGYSELYSRIGKEWMRVNSPEQHDIARIIKANGIDDDLVIRKITNKCNGDIRQVKYLVFKHKRKMEEEEQLKLS